MTFILFTRFFRLTLSPVILLLCLTPDVSSQTALEHFKQTKILDFGWGEGSNEMGFFKEQGGFLYGPNSFDVDHYGLIYILDSVNKRVSVFTQDGARVRTFQIETTGLISFIEIDDLRNVWINDAEKYRIIKYSHTGDFQHRIIYGLGKRGVKEPYITIRDSEIFLVMSKIEIGNEIKNSKIYEGTTYQAKRIKLPMNQRGRLVGKISGSYYNTINIEDKIPKIIIYDKDGLIKDITFLGIDPTHSVVFLSEDNYGNIYFKLTSPIKNTTQIWKYSSDL
ncbi:MAG: hypothetical protein HOC71_07730, partial [Candidatus Latescibacteria bacterium]|nr:hypothetical protein [Candidatus Latescibacterota bacterium]